MVDISSIILKLEYMSNNIDDDLCEIQRLKDEKHPLMTRLFHRRRLKEYRAYLNCLNNSLLDIDLQVCLILSEKEVIRGMPGIPKLLPHRNKDSILDSHLEKKEASARWINVKLIGYDNGLEWMIPLLIYNHGYKIAD